MCLHCGAFDCDVDSAWTIESQLFNISHYETSSQSSPRVLCRETRNIYHHIVSSHGEIRIVLFPACNLRDMSALVHKAKLNNLIWLHNFSEFLRPQM